MKTEAIYRRTRFCRLCTNKDLVPVLDLGMQALANFPAGPGQGIMAPIQVLLCEGCGLVQLAHTVDRDTMYSQYWYRSGTTETMRRAMREVVKAVNQVVQLEPDDHVLDIGSNDGTLLSYYSPLLKMLYGVEPAELPLDEYPAATSIYHDYFSYDLLKEHRPFKAITSIAMFYDLDRPLDFMADVADLLHPDGVWINQMNELGLVLESGAVDFFSHEHLTLWALETFCQALTRVGLEAFRFSTMPLNGGTCRAYVQHQGGKHKPLSLGPTPLNMHLWQAFTQRFQQNVAKLNRFILQEIARGRRTFAYGAGTRGNSLLQAYGLSVKEIPYAVDTDPNKIGRYLPGTDIPIISDAQAQELKPAYYLILPYSYAEEFIKKEQKFLERGGQFIIPLPNFQVVRKNTREAFVP